MNTNWARGVAVVVGLVGLGLGAGWAEVPLQAAGERVEQADRPAVRMIAARLEAEVGGGQSKVTCQYVFVNEGPATTVLMGFPALVGGGWAPSPQPVRELRSYLDGRPVGAALKRTSRGEGYYTKSVRFEENMKRVVREVYYQPTLTVPGGLACVLPMPEGRWWRGTVSRVDVVLRWTGAYDWGRARVTGSQGAGWVVSEDGRQLKRSQTNVDTAPGLRLEFLPGWNDLRVDGYQITGAGSPVAVRATREQVEMTTRALGAALRAQVRYDAATKAATIIGSNHKLVLKTGSSTALVDGREVRLPRAVRYESGGQWVVVKPIFDKLGWRMLADHRNGRLELFTGQPPAWEGKVKGPGGKTAELYLVSRGGVLLGEIRQFVEVIPGAKVSSPKAGEAAAGSVKIALSKEEEGPHFEDPPPGAEPEAGQRHELWLTWNSTQATLDGKPFTLTAAPYVNLLGHGMAPLAALGKALGLKTTYAEGSKTVTVGE